MVHDELVNWVKENHENGVPIEQLRQTLEKAGHPDETITEIFEKAVIEEPAPAKPAAVKPAAGEDSFFSKYKLAIIVVVIILVLLVAVVSITVLAPMLLYFWVGGLATKSPMSPVADQIGTAPEGMPTMPIVINVMRARSCTATEAAAMVQNLSPSGSVDLSELYIYDDTATKVYSTTSGTLEGGESKEALFVGQFTTGETYVITADANVGQAMLAC